MFTFGNTDLGEHKPGEIQTWRKQRDDPTKPCMIEGVVFSAICEQCSGVGGLHGVFSAPGCKALDR